MKFQPVSREVIHWHGFDGDTGHRLRFAVRQHSRLFAQLLRQFFRDRSRGNNRRAAADGFQRSSVQVVAVNVSDQNQIRLRQSVEALAAADGIDINRLVLPSHRERRVVDRVND